MEERVKRVEFISDILNFLDVCPCWKVVQDEFLSHLPLASSRSLTFPLFLVYSLLIFSKLSSFLLSLSRFSSFVTEWFYL